ncbi:hypothetical protein BB558_003547 [Smittium angustum]|uniref:Rho-GAP domain-containing protein n=1 Tax=Smittium angustum TaxID=133377 RepID=A0A2U1J5M9_SMIAN|nr:hypothetical protein BB558_003547 [Smittium angustum]
MTLTSEKNLIQIAKNRGFSIEIADGDFGENVDHRLLYQAGLDNEAMPIVVFSECYLPDEKLVDYDLLVEKIKKKFNDLVESDYTIVYFASSEVQKPSWTWLINTYHLLDRKFKKNLKHMYLVHPSTWTKILLNTFGTIISNKFYSKLVYVDNLEQLNHLIPTKHMSIPESVIEYDSKLDHSAYKTPIVKTVAEIKSKNAQKTLFGANVSDIVTTPKNSEVQTLPLKVATWLLILHKNGTFTKNIFRHRPTLFNLTTLRHKIQANPNVSSYELDTESCGYHNDIHAVASLLKLFFYELQPPIFNRSLVEIVKDLPVAESKEDIADISVALDLERDRIDFIKSKILPEIPAEYRQLLAHLFCVLNNISHNSQDNKMTAHSLAMVWAPILIDWDNIDNNTCLQMTSVCPAIPSVGSIIQNIIQYFYIIFSDEIHAILDVEYIHSETLMAQMENALNQQLSIYRN